MRLVEVVKDVCVPMLSVREMIEETEKAWLWERAQLASDLDVSNAGPPDRLRALQDHSTRRGSTLVLLMATMRLETAERIVRTAIVKAGKDADGVLPTMTPRQISDKAAELCGYSVEPGNVQSPATKG